MAAIWTANCANASAPVLRDIPLRPWAASCNWVRFDIDAVFGSDHAGFQSGKSRLHQQDQDGTGQHPGQRLKRWCQWHGIFSTGDLQTRRLITGWGRDGWKGVVMTEWPNFTWNMTDDYSKRGHAQSDRRGDQVPTLAFNDEEPVRGRSLSFSPKA